MSALDAPSRESCVVRRERTNTPLQALLLLNETQYVECARKLAERALVEGGKTSDDQIRYLFKLVLIRPPTATELAVLQATYAEQSKAFHKTPADADKLILIGETKPTGNLPKPELAALTLVANVVLNLDEAVTKE
jgi:hypothetical protein